MLKFDESGFTAYLAQHDRRNTTIRKHIGILHYLASRVVSFDFEALSDFLTSLKLEGKSNAYLNGIINAIRLYAQYKNLDDTLQHLKQYKKITPPKATMSDEEIEKFLALPYPKSCKPYYDHITHTMIEPVLAVRWRMWTLFWSICAYTGMRPGEVAKLTKSAVDWGRGVFVIEESKTNQPRVAPIPINIKAQLEKYLDNLQTDDLFPSAQGGTHYSCGGRAVVDNVDWHYQWKQRLKLLKLSRPHLTPYSFRHSYATALLESDVSLFHVKKLLGHHDLKSTLVYEHLTTKDLIKAQQKLPSVRKGASPEVILQSLIEYIRSFRIQEDNRFAFNMTEDSRSIQFSVSIKDGN